MRFIPRGRTVVGQTLSSFTCVHIQLPPLCGAELDLCFACKVDIDGCCLDGKKGPDDGSVDRAAQATAFDSTAPNGTYKQVGTGERKRGNMGGLKSYRRSFYIFVSLRLVAYACHDIGTIRVERIS